MGVGEPAMGAGEDDDEELEAESLITFIPLVMSDVDGDTDAADAREKQKHGQIQENKGE